MSLFAFGTGAFRAASRNLQNIQQARADIAKEERAGQEARDLLSIKNDYAVEAAEELAKTRAKAAKKEMQFRSGESALQRANELEKAQIIATGKKIDRQVNFLKANEVIGPEDNPLVTFRYNTDEKAYTSEIFDKLSRMGPEGFKNLMNSDYGSRVRSILRERIDNFRDHFGEDIVVTEGNVRRVVGKTNPIPTIQFPSLLKSNEEFGKEIKRLQNKIYSKRVTDPKKIMDMVMSGGQVVAREFPKEGQHRNDVLGAAAFYVRQNINITENPLLNLERTHKISYKEPKDKKFFRAAANPAVQRYLEGTGEVSSTNYNAYKSFISDPKNGFVDRDGLLNNDFLKLIDMFGLRTDTVGDRNRMLRVGDKLTDRTFSMAAKADPSLQKRKLQIQEASQGSEAALKTINELIETAKRTGVGGAALTRLLAFGGAIPEVLKEVKQLQSIFTGTRKKTILAFVDGKYKETSRFDQKEIEYTDLRTGKKVKGTVEDRIDKAFVTFNTDINSQDKSVQAARVEALEIILAYQLTSILQGGTGGRTISDQDVTRTLKVFSGNLTSLPQKLHKLNYLKKIISLAGQRARLYAQAVKGSSNYNLYETALRNERILDDLYGSAGTVTLDNVYEKVTDHSNEFERNIPFDKLSKKTAKGHMALARRRIYEDDNGNIRPRTDETTLGKNGSLIAMEAWAQLSSGLRTGGKDATLVPMVEPTTGAKLLYAENNLSVVKRAWGKTNKALSVEERIKSEGVQLALRRIEKRSLAWQVSKGKPIRVDLKLVPTEDGSVEFTVVARNINDVKIVPDPADPDKGYDTLYLAEEKDQEFSESSTFEKLWETSLKETNTTFSNNGNTALLRAFKEELGSDPMKTLKQTREEQAGGEVNKGIAQWRGPRLAAFEKYIKEVSGDQANMPTNVRFVLKELQEGEEGGAFKKDYNRLYEDLTKNPRGHSVEVLLGLINGVYLRPNENTGRSQLKYDKDGLPVPKYPKQGGKKVSSLSDAAGKLFTKSQATV
jgi:hypothetical protein